MSILNEELRLTADICENKKAVLFERINYDWWNTLNKLELEQLIAELTELKDKLI